MAARVEALCISTRKGVRKTPISTATFIENQGIEGDAHAGDWHRQVSLLSMEDIDTVRARGLPDLSWGAFAENIVISGLPVSSLGLGSRIKLGEEVVLSLSQIGKTCHSRCAIYYLSGDCIMPRLGLFARVVSGGEVRAGDEASILEAVPRDMFQAVVITVSDRCSRGETPDTAGPAVQSLLEQSLPVHVYASEILPDERANLAKRLEHYCDSHSIDVIVTVGGTGFSPRDVTPEAIAGVIERPTPGLDEAMRLASREKTPFSVLSRAVSGIRGQTLILSVPGSPSGATENLSAILIPLGHGLKKLRGDPTSCAKPQRNENTSEDCDVCP